MLILDGYDRAPELTRAERRALRPLQTTHGWGGRTVGTILGSLRDAERLVRPLADAMAAVHGNAYWKDRALIALLRGCVWQDSAYWAWDSTTWARVLAPATTRLLTANQPNQAGATRHYMIAAAYVLGCLPDLSVIVNTGWLGVAQKAFDREAVDDGVARVEAVVQGWRYGRDTRRGLRNVTARAMLAHRSAHLEDMRLTRLEELRYEADLHERRKGLVWCLSRALADLGILDGPLPHELRAHQARRRDLRTADLAPKWAAWVDRWEATSTLAPKTRGTGRLWLLKIGRWLRDQHPEIAGPEQWTSALAAEAVAAVDRMQLGEYTETHPHSLGAAGRPLSPRSKSAALHAMSVAFRDAQDWEWIPRRFTPHRTFAVPRSISALINPSPRVIADDMWAKLMWAGLNLGDADVRSGTASTPGRRPPHYPLEFIKALAAVWLFAGLRSDEITRLRIGCLRWQSAADQSLAAGARTCLLDVPAHKTGCPYTKPVDPIVGDAIETWEAVRGLQPMLADRKTGEVVAFLFCHRGRHVRKEYLNRYLIPMLCAKAGIPPADTRGTITSHRARATIASQLYNAKDPMTLFELQAWLGHRSPESTQHYARITPTTLTKAYRDAGYFARNVRAIEVLVDRGVVESGAAASGTPWQYFDLGHGYCTYSFFEQCPHRMACARCDFYVPKESTRAQLLEAQGNLQRMIASIPLTEDERAAVDEGAAAVDQLLDRLADTPTPAGPTPRQ
ncbi:MAG: tyrosine-type recombinase/integrase, partial [Candidatus Dormibacteraeota bacterium]|nr:tyrosine-type recombinase/integrase [Candidatus Dormibacteraeota bacterium]